MGRIESALGSGEAVHHGSVSSANTTIRYLEYSAGRDLVGPLTTEFNSVVETMNKLMFVEIDQRLAPNLYRVSHSMTTTQSPLPDLESLRTDRAPIKKYLINRKIKEVDGTITDQAGEGWSWLNDLSRPESVASALWIEAWGDIVCSIPENKRFAQGLKDDNGEDDASKTLVLAFEEAMVLYHPRFRLNRLVSQWYTTDEGFNQNFVDYSRSIDLLIATEDYEPDLLNRKNLRSVKHFIERNPLTLIRQMRTLNRALIHLNQMSSSGDIPQMLENVSGIQTLLKENPLPSPISSTESGRNIFGQLTRFLHAVRELNQDMASAEEEELQPKTEEDISCFARFHLDAQGECKEEVIISGLLVQMVERWARKLPEYRTLTEGKLTKALLEVLAYKERHTSMFEYLSQQEHGLSWYALEKTFSRSLLSRLMLKGLLPQEVEGETEQVKIMIVDDNLLSIFPAQDILEMEGHQIIKAESSQEALSRLEEQNSLGTHFDLLIIKPHMLGKGDKNLLRIAVKQGWIKRPEQILIMDSNLRRQMSGKERALLAKQGIEVVTEPVDVNDQLFRDQVDYAIKIYQELKSK
jgi:CheY-like chemotaxis protein